MGKTMGLANSPHTPLLPLCTVVTLLYVQHPDPRNRPSGHTLLAVPTLLYHAQCCFQLPFPTPSSICFPAQTPSSISLMALRGPSCPQGHAG